MASSSDVDRLVAWEGDSRRFFVLSDSTQGADWSEGRDWSEFFGGAPAHTLDLSDTDLYGFLFLGDSWPLVGTNFRRAILARSRWLYATIEQADFTESDLRGCQMEHVRAAGAKFDSADLRDADLKFATGSSDDSISFFRTDLRWARFQLIAPVKMILDEADLEHAKVELFGEKNSESAVKIRDTFLDSLTPHQRSVVEVSHKRCFIATAVYPLHEEYKVVALQDFREARLRRYRLGRVFISLYENWSPFVAEWLLKNPKAARWTRAALDLLVSWTFLSSFNKETRR